MFYNETLSINGFSYFSPDWIISWSRSKYFLRVIAFICLGRELDGVGIFGDNPIQSIVEDTIDKNPENDWINLT